MSSNTSKPKSVFGTSDISKMLDKGVSIDLYLIVELLMSMIISHHTAGRDYSPKVDPSNPTDGANQGDKSASESGKTSKQKNKPGKGKAGEKVASGKSGPPDQWISIVNNKKPSELIALGKEVLDAIDSCGDQQAIEQVVKAVVKLEEHVIANAQKITVSLLFDNIKPTWLTPTPMDAGQFSDAKKRLKMAVIHILFINEARIGLSNLRGEAKRVGLFPQGEELDCALARIEAFRHDNAHKLQEFLGYREYGLANYRLDVKGAITALDPFLQDIPERIEAESMMTHVLETQEKFPKLLEGFDELQTRVVELQVLVVKLEGDVSEYDKFLVSIVMQIVDYLAKRGKQGILPSVLNSFRGVKAQPSFPVQSTDDAPVSIGVEENDDTVPEVDSWSYPVFGSNEVVDEYSPRNNFRLRVYQEEMAKKSLGGKNDIVLLPTGSGKTYIAIAVIITHLNNNRAAHLKVVFIAPTTELASQQLEKICGYLPAAWNRKARKITGDDQMSSDQLKTHIKGAEYVVLVVTPEILKNYFHSSADASVSDFSLIIFDEYHHAKKGHPYNDILRKYVENQDLGREMAAGASSPSSPQLLGLTATIGIGDSKCLEMAQRYIIGMCAKFGLDSPPSESTHLTQSPQSKPDEGYVLVESKRSNKMSDCIENELMEFVEHLVIKKLSDPKFAERKVKPAFPVDRHHQVYEQYVVSFREALACLHGNKELRQDIQYCMVALDHLREYYLTLQLVNLLRCEHGVDYLKELDAKQDLKVVDEIWKKFEETLPRLQTLSKEVDGNHPNEKIVKLAERLAELFSKRPDSKVIIFVRERIVAYFLASLLSAIPLRGDLKFKATQFIGSASSPEKGGMKTRERKDIREGFEGKRYNILVATSLLEEGIDIQACNMVVRYMYVKDMIAKIQSRGRARHAEGQMIAILDSKLYNQEKSNDQKEAIMYEALEKINAMPQDEFKRQVAEERKFLFPKKVVSPDIAGNPQASAKVSCKSCGKLLGDMATVRKYTSHYFILDRGLSDRVVAQRAPKAAPEFDGVECYGLLKCRGETNVCGKQVGTLMKFKTGHYFGMWVLGGVMVNDTPIKKYKTVLSMHKVKIEDINDAELSEAAKDHSFRLP